MKEITRNVTTTKVSYAIPVIGEDGQASFGETQQLDLNGARTESVAQNIVKRDVDKKAIVLAVDVQTNKYAITLTDFLANARIVDEEETA